MPRRPASSPPWRCCRSAIGCRRWSTNQHRAKWQQIFTPSIAGKTVLVVGLGEMGGAAAKSAKRLGMRVLGVRRNPRPTAMPMPSCP